MHLQNAALLWQQAISGNSTTLLKWLHGRPCIQFDLANQIHVALCEAHSSWCMYMQLTLGVYVTYTYHDNRCGWYDINGKLMGGE
jgi:hypothetical protein